MIDLGRIKLPLPAMTKLEMIALEAEDARDSALVVTKRLKEASSALIENPGDTNMMARVDTLKARQIEAQTLDRTLRDLVSTIQAQLAKIAATGRVFVVHEGPPRMKKRKGFDVEAAVSEIRQEINATKAEIMQVERVPVTATSKRQAVSVHLDRLLASNIPTATINNFGEMRIQLGMGAEGISLHDAKGSRLLAFMMHIVGKQVVLDMLAPQMEAHPDALSPADRDARIRDLRATLLDLERGEEHLVDDTSVLRRSDANALAVLGIVPVLRQQVETSAA